MTILVYGAIEMLEFREHGSGVVRAFGALAVLSLCSKLSGFARLAVFATMYGGGSDADLFLAAMLLPDLLYKFISDGLIAAAAVPLFVKERDNAEISDRMFWSLFWPISFIGLLITLILEAFADKICEIITPGFDAILAVRMVRLWRILAPYTLFSLQAGLLTAFLNAHEIFAKPALGPILVNLITIIGILFVGRGPVEYIGWFVLTGAFVQLLWLLWLAVRSGPDYNHRSWILSKIDWNVFLKFAYAAAPTAGWVLLGGIIPVFERALMSSVQVGALAALNYTDKLINLPLGIVAVSLATAAFPALSSAGEEERANLFDRTIWMAGILMTPMVLTMVGMSENITFIVYGRGKFNAEAMAMTAKLLENYALSLFPVIVVMLLNRLCFALGEYKMPFLIGSAAILVQMILDASLVKRFGVVGIAWGAVGAAFFQTVCLLIAFFKISVSSKMIYKAAFASAFWAVLIFVGIKPITYFAAFLNNFTAKNPLSRLLGVTFLWLSLQLTAVMIVSLYKVIAKVYKNKPLNV